MDYPFIWFILIGVLWTGYLVLEGFDFGVGALLPVLGGNGARVGGAVDEGENRRRVMLTAIGPHWDGNEVWLLTAGGAMFAAFPHWYATMFSAFYLPLLLLLVALIVRNMGLEYRHKRDDDTWRRRWDLAIIGGSVVAPFLVGVALTNVVRGVPLDADFEYVGSLWTLLNLPSLLGGVVFVALSVTHGAHFLALKTSGRLREAARRVAERAGLVSAVLAVVLMAWLVNARGSVGVGVLAVVAAVALVGSLVANRVGREGLAFVGTAITWAAAAAAYFVALHPNVMPTTLANGASLTIENAASTPMTLQIMSIAALVFVPIVLLYTAWSYWVFRRRLATDRLATPVLVK
ncbi:cytochrome d ubiquinol oxidase subunit II [Knoellia subterranea]|uniref:Cytochrome C oxidase assembly protein n=1 Tax=Knoellia subterranea KCTC 19937 TaxID=1385521 RepID=A0A0A0JJA4_9MICO|nr:cytochrome d ubiquinol oxidase subunit II [Knoellia subterranea]KGN37168.1 cytochrome C oxidase assembly protein [Knoellia subterranea KCTC 19937]